MTTTADECPACGANTAKGVRHRRRCPLFESITRRRWLIERAVEDGVPIMVAVEAVSTTALDHPEWNLDERRPRGEWWRDA